MDDHRGEIRVTVNRQPNGKWEAEAKHPSHRIWSVKVTDAESAEEAERMCRDEVGSLTFGKGRT